MSIHSPEANTAPIPDADMFRHIPVLADLTEAEHEALAHMLRVRELPANQPIFWIGDKGEDMYIIQKGRVRLSYPNTTGTEVTLSVLGSGAFFGELSLLDGGARTATAIAETPVSLLVLGRADFQQFLRNNPAAATHVIITLAKRQREAMEKIRGIRNVNVVADERITYLERAVDKAARIGASGWFLLVNIVFFAAWIVYHTHQHPSPVYFHDEPPTFFWLGFMVTLEAILLTMFVLNSQRRQADRDRIRSDLEYQVNLKAHIEIMELHQKVDQIASLLETVVKNQ